MLSAGDEIGGEAIADRVGDYLDRVVFRVAAGALSGSRALVTPPRARCGAP